MAPSETPHYDPSVDYYSLLGLTTSAATESEIRRAYRKTSILYHPDKVEPTPANLDKFHQLQVALNLLTDADAKATYDQKRDAQQRRKAENEALEARRRTLKEDLERREKEGQNGSGPQVGGTKRAWSERELAINRIREENRARMAAAGAKRAEEMRQREEESRKEETANGDTQSAQNGQQPDSASKSVRIRWIKQGEGLDIDAQSIEDEFSAGEVEHVVILKDKKRKMEGRGKVMLGTAVVIFSSLEAAKKAVKRGPWDGVESVEWMQAEANGKEKEV